MHTQEASRRHEDGFRRPPNPQKTPPRGQNGSETYRKSMFVVFSHFRFRLPFQASSWPQDGTREPQEEPTRCPGGGPRRVSQMRNGRCTSMVWVRGRPRGHWGASVGPESAPRRAQEGAPRCATAVAHLRVRSGVFPEGADGRPYGPKNASRRALAGSTRGPGMCNGRCTSMGRVGGLPKWPRGALRRPETARTGAQEGAQEGLPRCATAVAHLWFG